MGGQGAMHLQLNQDRIFAFKNFDDFNEKYFKRGLVAMDDLNKAQHIKEVRDKYAKRFQNSPYNWKQLYIEFL